MFHASTQFASESTPATTLNLALEAACLTVWVWNLRTDTIRWDAGRGSAEAWVPVDLEEGIDAFLETVVAPEDRQRVRDSLTSVRRTVIGCELEYRWRRSDGEIRWVRTAMQPLSGDTPAGMDQPVTGILCVDVDITSDRRHTQDLEAARVAADEANRLKSEFLANMSHEIRTPMTAILGYSDLLQRQLVDPDDRSLVDTIRHNGEFLLAIINDILDLAKIESGTMRVRHVPIDPAAVIDDVVSLMRVRAEARGLGLHISSSLQLPRLQSDPVRLRQILLNLIGNAIKFTARGGVTIHVDRHATGDLVVGVADSGSGIEAEDLERLFTPYEQLPEAEGRSDSTGLGLSICRRLAGELGGTIHAESRPGEGSRFTLRMPWVAASVGRSLETRDLPGVSDTGSQDRSGDRLDDYRIMVVDDRRDMRLLMQMVLEDAGATVLIAANGQEAIDHLKDQPEAADAVLLDMQMPVMDGYEAARILRERGWDKTLIAVTANAMAGEREACLRAGCDVYLTKPVEANRLVALLARRLQAPRHPTP